MSSAACATCEQGAVPTWIFYADWTTSCPSLPQNDPCPACLGISDACARTPPNFQTALAMDPSASKMQWASRKWHWSLHPSQLPLQPRFCNQLLGSCARHDFLRVVHPPASVWLRTCLADSDTLALRNQILRVTEAWPFYSEFRFCSRPSHWLPAPYLRVSCDFEDPNSSRHSGLSPFLLPGFSEQFGRLRGPRDLCANWMQLLGFRATSEIEQLHLRASQQSLWIACAWSGLCWTRNCLVAVCLRFVPVVRAEVPYRPYPWPGYPPSSLHLAQSPRWHH